MWVLVFRKKNSGVDVDLALFLYLLKELKINTMFKVFHA